MQFYAVEADKEAEIDYYSYLCDKINISSYNGKTYFGLARALHSEPFVVVVERDQNRVADALYMRREWADNMIAIRGLDKDNHSVNLGDVSLLEVLVSLAMSMENNIMYDNAEGDRTSRWFWAMMKNSGLDMFPDPVDGGRVDEMMAIIHRIVYREYDPNGVGGLFPVMCSRADQREVELWYQANAWLNERYF